MEERLPPSGGIRTSRIRDVGKSLRAACGHAHRWLASPSGERAVRITVELAKLYVRFKGTDVDLR